MFSSEFVAAITNATKFQFLEPARNLRMACDGMVTEIGALNWIYLMEYSELPSKH